MNYWEGYFRGDVHFSKHMLSCFSHVWLFATLRTVAHQAPLSIGFSRQEYWSGLPVPSSGDLPDPRIKSGSALAGRFFTTVISDKYIMLIISDFIKQLEDVSQSWMWEREREPNLSMGKKWNCKIQDFLQMLLKYLYYMRNSILIKETSTHSGKKNTLLKYKWTTPENKYLGCL